MVVLLQKMAVRTMSELEDDYTGFTAPMAVTMLELELKTVVTVLHKLAIAQQSSSIISCTDSLFVLAVNTETC